MKSLTDCYTLSNGVEIPCVGFGTWQTPDGNVTVASVKEALARGYRHIDTAAAYENEESVGRGIKESGVPRKEIFVTTKLQNTDHGYKETLAAFDLSLKKLGFDYIDLYLIHWPNPAKLRSRWQESNAETWRAFEELYKAGKVRSIGISNFHGHHIDALLKTATVVPQVNQIRLCPGDTQDEAVAHSRKHKMILEAYSPLGINLITQSGVKQQGIIFEVPELQALAKKYGKTVAQICLRWSLQMEFLPLPKSVTPSRIAENAEIFDFELSAEEVKTVADLKGVVGYSQDPDTTAF